MLYRILKAETTEMYKSKFLSYKHEIFDIVEVFIDDTSK